MVEALLEQAPWLTPTFLFLLLNIVIATIFLSSAFNRRLKHPLPTTPPQQQQLPRAPSLFSRVTSFNFSNYYPDHQPHNHHQHTNSAPSFFFNKGVEMTTQEESNVEPESKPSLFTRVTSFNFPGWASEEPGSKPEPEPQPQQVTSSSSSRRVVAREPYLLSRIASFSSLRKRVEEIGEVDTHRKTINNKKKKKEEEEKKKEEAINNNNNNAKKKEKKKKEEVDAKADDFINRFKQQLKMQRAESLLRYKSA